jgi:hypothetical protein
MFKHESDERGYIFREEGRKEGGGSQRTHSGRTDKTKDGSDGHLKHDMKRRGREVAIS